MSSCVRACVCFSCVCVGGFADPRKVCTDSLAPVGLGLLYVKERPSGTLNVTLKRQETLSLPIRGQSHQRHYGEFSVSFSASVLFRWSTDTSQLAIICFFAAVKKGRFFFFSGQV